MATLVRVFAAILLFFAWGLAVNYLWPGLLENKTFAASAGILGSILFWSWLQQSIRGDGSKRIDKSIWGWPWRR
jgi:hypothetical protein